MEHPAPDTPKGALATVIVLLLATGLGNVVALGASSCLIGCGAGFDPTCLDLGCIGGPTAGLIAACVTGVGALLSTAAALGIGLRQPWGWWLAALVFTAFLCSSCLPLSLLGLAMLASPEVREACTAPAPTE